MCMIYTWITCLKHLYYRCLHVYYSGMNYMYNTPKTTHIYYMCVTYVIHVLHIWQCTLWHNWCGQAVMCVFVALHRLPELLPSIKGSHVVEAF